MYVHAHICVHEHTCTRVQVSADPEEGVGSPGAGAIKAVCAPSESDAGK